MSRPTPVPRPARLYYVPTSHQQSHPRYIYTPAAQHEGGGGGGAVLRHIQTASGAAHDGRCRPRNNIHVGPQQACRSCLPRHPFPSTS